MRNIRIFEQQILEEDFVLINDENIHYLVDVLRLRGGERVEVLTADSRVFEGVFERKNGRYVIGDLVKQEVQKRIFPEINLFIAIIKGSSFDYAVEKASEIGANSITPVYCRYSSAREVSARKIERFRRIARSSALQSRRDRGLIINAPLGLEQALNILGKGNNLYLHPYSGLSLNSVFSGEVDFGLGFNIFSGPEGGFSDSERDLFEKKGVKGVSLYTNILRAETIPLVICAIILYEYQGRSSREDGR